MAKHRGLNPTTLTLIIITIGLATSFTRSITLNLIVTGLSLLYLASQRVAVKKTLVVLLIALPLALGSWLSFSFFGSGDRVWVAWVYATRIYAYLTLAMTLTMTTDAKDLLVSLHQHLKLPNTFVYGLLASLNMFSRLKGAFQQIRYSALLRGRVYHLWQPRFYLRLIIVALNWSGDLAMAMTSQGFTEGAPRTELVDDVLPKWQYGLVVVLLVTYLAAVFLWQPK